MKQSKVKIETVSREIAASNALDLSHPLLHCAPAMLGSHLGHNHVIQELLGDGNPAIPKEIAVHPVLAFPVENLVIRLECVRIFETIAHSLCNDDRIEKLRLLEE